MKLLDNVPFQKQFLQTMGTEALVIDTGSSQFLDAV